MVDEQTVSLGQVVQSKAGRDKGRFFVVIGLAEESYVLLADGDLRKITRPKRKKIKHFTCKPVVNQDIMKRLSNGEKIYDQDICQALKSFEQRIAGKMEEEQPCQNKM